MWFGVVVVGIVAEVGPDLLAHPVVLGENTF